MPLIPTMGPGWLFPCANSAASIVLVPLMVLIARPTRKNVRSILTCGRLPFAFLASRDSTPVPAVFTCPQAVCATAVNHGWRIGTQAPRHAARPVLWQRHGHAALPATSISSRSAPARHS